MKMITWRLDSAIQSLRCGAFSCILCLRLGATSASAQLCNFSGVFGLSALDLEATRRCNRRYRDLLRLRGKVLARIDEPIPLEIVLLVVKLPIPPIHREQFVVTSPLYDLPVLEHQDLI